MRWWYFDNVINTDEFYPKLSLTTLAEMRLPTIPEDLLDQITIKWKNKDRYLVEQASEALTDRNKIPIIEIIYKKYKISEEYPYHLAIQELQFIIETAREMNERYKPEITQKSE